MAPGFRQLAVAAVFAIVVEGLVAGAPKQRPEAGRPDSGEFVSMRGCVHGSLLTSVRFHPATAAGALTGNNRYRLVGSKEIRTQIKKVVQTVCNAL